MSFIQKAIALMKRWEIARVTVRSLVLLAGLMVSGHVPAADNSATITLHGQVTLLDLPSGSEQRPAAGMSRNQVAELLEQQPSIILDGAILTITAPSVGSSRSLALNRLEMKNGARIVTNGVNLEIDAVAVASDGSGGFIAFDPAPRAAAAVGQNGTAGLSAGTLVLDAALNGNDLLHVDLNGQDGQPGGVGVTGPTGAQGPRGENGADHLFDCAHGPGDGGAGSPGGTGGGGGAGGPGGSGGKLILRGAIASQRTQIEFLAPGGKGGSGGAGGQGGPGGPGGQGGSGTTYCRGGHGGPPGVAGPIGPPGPAGKDGENGTIFAE